METLAYRDYIDKTLERTACTKKAVFLDRDGTIHLDKNQTHKISDLEYFPDTFIGAKKLSDAGFILVIVTNQDGLRQGKYHTSQFHDFNEKIIRDFSEQGIAIGAIYYSPFEKKDDHFSFKPNPGMLIRAQRELNIDFSSSYLIGDQISDVLAAQKAGVKALMVTTGLYPENDYRTNEYLKLSPITFPSFSAACDYIINNNSSL